MITREEYILAYQEREDITKKILTRRDSHIKNRHRLDELNKTIGSFIYQQNHANS